MNKRRSLQPDKRSVFIIILLILIPCFCRTNKEEDSSLQISYRYNPQLYNLELTDWKGRLVRLNELREKALFIQFVDVRSSYDNEYLLDVVRDWSEYPLAIVVFTDKPAQLVLNNPHVADKITIINHSFEKVRQILDSNKSNSFCYLFGFNRDYIFRAETTVPYEPGIKYEFIKLLNGVFFKPSDLIGEKNNIYKTQAFNEDVLSHLEKNKFTIIFLISKYCDSCDEGIILSTIRKLYSNGTVNAIIFFYIGMNRDDIVNFKELLDIKFPVYLAEGYLLNNWQKLIQEYTVKGVSSIALVANNDGIIKDHYFSGCECTDEFIRRMYALAKMEGDK